MDNIDLYLTVAPSHDCCNCCMTVQSAVTLFVHRFCMWHLNRKSLRVYFVQDSTQENIVELNYQYVIAVNEEPNFISAEQVPTVAKSCTFPVAVCNQGRLVVCGLSSVLRLIVSFAQHLNSSQSDQDSQTLQNAVVHRYIIGSLLGPRQNCLKACAEVSPWVKYCEVTLPGMIQQLCNDMGQRIVPEFLELEAHLQEVVEQHHRQLLARGKAVKLHCENIAKTVSATCNSAVQTATKVFEQSNAELPAMGNASIIDCKISVEESAKSDSSNEKPLNISQEENMFMDPRFVEGDCLQLTDLVVFFFVTIAFNKFPKLKCSVGHLNRVWKWYLVMHSEQSVNVALRACGLLDPFALNLFTTTDNIVPENDTDTERCHAGPAATLNVNSQLSSYNMRKDIKSKFKASQSAINEVLHKLEGMDLMPNEVLSHQKSKSLPWAEYPTGVLPSTQDGGGVPDKRAGRKLEQLENMVAAVVAVMEARCSQSCTIVDFCAGCGYLGILLAYLFPKCKVFLLENKEQSLQRAAIQISQLKLDNVTCVQCNLTSFHMNYDIGVCLHGCGIATDLVLNKCIESNAVFVICPCCYGAVRNSHRVKYPRSRKLIDSGITTNDYLVLGHAADQTQVMIPKQRQGQLCMAYIDTDRSLLATEHGYSVTLYRMNPPTCSPKNHIIVGIV